MTEPRAASKPLCDPVLKELGLLHGFGVRGSKVPESTAFPTQTHGVEVVEGAAWNAGEGPVGDAIVSTRNHASVGIVTADCVPILAAAVDGSVVVAIHAGWRGLAAGVIEAGLTALRARLRARAGAESLVAAVGPAARGCCYEVDEPVRGALEASYPGWLDPEILAPGRSGHYQLDLPGLATRVLDAAGLDARHIGTAHRVCTICDPVRFESYRRDGPAAGRLRHFISSGGPSPQRG